ncbi:DUF4276 family protein [Sorangium sp. So ce1036]|uniref:DUF4276 family protein n=1 Tax=Sorangium sp. So ce1036 TaxID=3133328 RepID=UPI003F51CD64
MRSSIDSPSRSWRHGSSATGRRWWRRTPTVATTIPSQAKFRDPDAIRGGTCEALERVLRKAGYFAGGLRKIEAARAIAEHMDPKRNRSGSFRILHAALQEMTPAPEGGAVDPAVK